MTIVKAIQDLGGTPQDDFVDLPRARQEAAQVRHPARGDPRHPAALRKEMHALSDSMEFEKAAAVRDRIKELEEIRLSLGG